MSVGRVETRAAKVAVASALSTLLSVALQLVSVPVCIRYWGNESYGLWLALFAVFSVLKTLDSGYSAYVGNELNVLYHRDQAALRRTLASGVVGSTVVGLLQLLVGTVLVFSGALTELLGVSEEVARDQRVGVALGVLLGGWVLTGTYLGIVHRLQVPAGLLHQATWWLMGYQIAQAAAVIVAAALRLGLGETAVVFAGSQVAVYLATAVYVARKLPAYFPWWRRPSWGTGLRDLYRSSVLMGANFLGQASGSWIVMLVSASLGAAIVPAFTTVRTIANLWTMLGSVLISPLLPEVIRYHAQRDGKKLVSAVEAHWLLATSAVNLSVLASFPFLDEVYGYWTGGGIVLERSLLCYLLLSVVIATPVSLITSYLVGINELRAVTAIFAPRGLVPLLVGLVLLPRLGIDGVGIAVVCGELSGPILLGLAFYRRQLRGLDAVSATRAWRPVALGTASVAAFLLGRALDVGAADALYFGSLAGALASAAWCWSSVGGDVRERSLRLLHRSARVGT